MVRRATKSVIGLQDNQPKDNGRITIHPHIRDEGYHPHGIPTIRAKITEAVIKDLDTADKLWEVAAVHMASYQQRLASLNNQHVNPRTFKAKDFVLRRVF